MLSFIENDVQQSAILLYELTFHRFKLQINTTIMIIIKVQYMVIADFYDLITSDLRHFMNHVTPRSGRVLFLPIRRGFLGFENDIS